MLWVLLAAVLVVALAFAIGSSQGGSGSVQVRPVNGSSTDEIVDEMERLVDDNTR